MDGPLCKSLYVDLVSKFWLKQNFFDKKDFDCNNNPIYPTFFCWLVQFFFLATIELASSRYHVCQFSDKTHNIIFFGPNLPKNEF